MLSDVVKGLRIPPHLIELELTETAIMVPVENLDTIMSSIVELGVRLSIDDFGTGYSSINHLQQLPIHTLKIDKSFTKKLIINKRDTLIVKSLITMATNLGLNVVAEGVETAEQLKFLKDNNCLEVQGFYFYSPLQADVFAKLLPQPKAKNK